ncbi:MAG: hypothetical protein ACK5KP_09370 [Paludibacteraceae bacterium]
MKAELKKEKPTEQETMRTFARMLEAGTELEKDVTLFPFRDYLKNTKNITNDLKRMLL